VKKDKKKKGGGKPCLPGWPGRSANKRKVGKGTEKEKEEGKDLLHCPRPASIHCEPLEERKKRGRRGKKEEADPPKSSSYNS